MTKRKESSVLVRVRPWLSVFLTFAIFAMCEVRSFAKSAEEIVKESEIEGGVIAQIGCNVKQIAELAKNEKLLIHTVDTDKEKVILARKEFYSLGINERVFVSQFNGKILPYIDNFVNIFIAENIEQVSKEEILRVLVPNGLAYIKDNGKWNEIVKPENPDVDEWGHYLYDSTNNPVANDKVVAPPKRFQWNSGPKWCRNHDHTASLHTIVSAGGKIFYIMDEGAKTSVMFDAKIILTGQDAYNGTILWKRQIKDWMNHLWPLKSGPFVMTRSLVATKKELYVTLGLNEPVTALNPNTGEIIRTYENTNGTEEIIYSNGILYFAINPARSNLNEFTLKEYGIMKDAKRTKDIWSKSRPEQNILKAFDAESGKLLWEKKTYVTMRTIMADKKSFYFRDTKDVVCLNKETGEEVWRSNTATKAILSAGGGPILFSYQGVIVYTSTTFLYVFDEKTGKKLWEIVKPRAGHHCPTDVFGIKGLIWANETQQKDKWVIGWDLQTGEEKVKFKEDVKHKWFHQRCYPGKATVNYIISCIVGSEYINLETHHWNPHSWARGSCITGILPCNGMLYTTPTSCGCNQDSKLEGFHALASSNIESLKLRKINEPGLLEKGESYSHAMNENEYKNEWATYRCNPSRNSNTPVSVPVDIQKKWDIKLKGKLTAPVIAEDKIFLASIHLRTVFALDATNGKTIWEYIAGGRVDSPPTIYKGRVFFGSADGWVYCLSTIDGKLIWKYCAAPAQRISSSYGQMESIWPLHGSVLIEKGHLYCVAGRTRFLDRGLRILKLDPLTGQKIAETIMNRKQENSKEDLTTAMNAGISANNAILTSNGNNIFMTRQGFDFDTKAINVKEDHIIAPKGFLEDNWMHRVAWYYGDSPRFGFAYSSMGLSYPTGKIMVCDKDNVYAFGRKPEFRRWTTPIQYQIYCAKKEIIDRKIMKAHNNQDEMMKWAEEKRSLKEITKVEYNWMSDCPKLHVWAMTLADKNLIVAGTPRFVDELKAWRNLKDPKVKEEMKQQEAAWEGKKGGVLQIYSKDKGELLKEYKLDNAPIWDGMAIAKGAIYITCRDGSVICLK